MKRIIYGVEDIPTIVAQELIPLLQSKNIFAFRGPLGSGKTTMIKEFCEQLGIDDVVSSPTFSYVNVYRGSLCKKMYHFDLYRLNVVDEFFQLGFDEYLSREGAICVIEWPEVIDELLSGFHVCSIALGYVSDDEAKREITIV